MLAIDHIVLTVSDIKKIAKFYTEILEMTLEEFKPPGTTQSRFALRFGTQKINLHSVFQPFKPHAEKPVSGSADLCFVSEKSVYLWIEKFEKHSVIIEEGPVQISIGSSRTVDISIYTRSRWKFNRDLKSKLKPTDRTIFYSSISHFTRQIYVS